MLVLILVQLSILLFALAVRRRLALLLQQDCTAHSVPIHPHTVYDTLFSPLGSCPYPDGSAWLSEAKGPSFPLWSFNRVCQLPVALPPWALTVRRRLESFPVSSLSAAPLGGQKYFSCFPCSQSRRNSRCRNVVGCSWLQLGSLFHLR